MSDRVRRDPAGMHDMTDWRVVSCFAADMIRRNGADLKVAATLTDPDGIYGSPIVFTEWWWVTGADDHDQYPVLREYLYPADPDRSCEHFVASGPGCWKEETDE